MNRGDRLWMHQRRTLGDGLHLEFVLGVNHFLDFAFSHAQSWGKQKISCPCDKCTTCYMCTHNELLHHLYFKGFMRDFMMWMTISYKLIMISQVPIHLANQKDFLETCL